MTFLTIEEINSNPKHAPIDDETNFINRIQTEIIKTFYELNINLPINKKTVPNLYYRKVILKMTDHYTYNSDYDMTFPQKGFIWPTPDDPGVGTQADWNEDLAYNHSKKLNRKNIKEKIDFTEKYEFSNTTLLEIFMMEDDCLNFDKPCPKWY